MLDWQLFGANAGWHHLVSLGFHLANTLLLFFVVRQMTGALWRSAIVAALFGLHPAHVESVAWIAERKDLLGTFFFLLTLWAYTRYAQAQSRVESRESSVHPALNPPSSIALAMEDQPSTLNLPRPALNPQPSTLNYSLALLFFALGLMSKPMVMTLPCVLLLLDFWPLRRLQLPVLHSFSDGGSTPCPPKLQRRRINPPSAIALATAD